MANLPQSGQADSIDSLTVTREQFRLQQKDLLEFLAQALGNVSGSYGTQTVDPLALTLQGTPTLAASAEPTAAEDGLRLVTARWVRRYANSASPTAPSNPIRGQLWIDNAQDPPVLKVWDDTPAPGSWSAVVAVQDATTLLKGVVQLADAAAISAGTAGRVVDAAQLKDAVLLKRTGTVLEPATAGDQIKAPLVPTNGALGFRNVIINGDLKINQRNVTIAAAATGAYGPDRWKKVDASNMTQIIEDLNVVHGAKYTLSWKGGTPQVLTAPASGHWTLPNIPITATEIQLELGEVATPFERRPVGLELILCRRYYEKSYKSTDAPGTATQSGIVIEATVGDGSGLHAAIRPFMVSKCKAPSIGIWDHAGTANRCYVPGGSGLPPGNYASTEALYITQDSFRLKSNTYGTNVASVRLWHYVADAEL